MIQHNLAKTIADVIKEDYGLDVVPQDIQITPAQAGFGDYSTNIAFKLARELGKAPRDIAAELSARITHPNLARAEAAGAGYLNLTLNNQYWLQCLEAISIDYGKSTLGDGKKLQVEYISANPTGPTTIGNARGGFIGEVLSRVLERVGYDVTREYYFNNAGTQISKLVESVKMEAGLLEETDERQYRGDYIAKLAQQYKTQLASLPDKELGVLLTSAILKEYIQPAVSKMGIEFDVWFNESDLIDDGRFDQTIANLRERGLVSEHDGAVWLNTGQLGDERTERVIVKSNGDPTYLAPDLAYHDDLFGRRGFDYSIKVLGPDHVAQFPSVYAAIHALYPQKTLRMASYQWLRVVRDGKEVKVSKRLGQFITVNDLIDEVTQPVALFLTLMRSADSHMDFDLDLAKETSAKNPYYYVMYAYARAHSVITKGTERGLSGKAGGELDVLELKLVKIMDQLPELLLEIERDYGVHRLTFYGIEVAKLFQEYYESQRIIDLPPEKAQNKLYFLQQFIVFMDIYWSLLGIEPLARMDR